MAAKKRGPYVSQSGEKIGSQGGHARAKKLSARRRREIAQKAAETRWGKK